MKYYIAIDALETAPIIYEKIFCPSSIEEPVKMQEKISYK